MKERALGDWRAMSSVGSGVKAIPIHILGEWRVIFVAKFQKAGYKLTQANAAEILGISQSRVSDLVRGKWERFSLEMLVTLATRAGKHVRLKTAA